MKHLLLFFIYFCGLMVPLQLHAEPEYNVVIQVDSVTASSHKDYVADKHQIEQVVREIYHNHDNEMNNRYTWLGIFVTLVVAIFGIGVPYYQNKRAEEKLKEQEKKINGLVKQVEDSALRAKTSENTVMTAAKTMTLISQAMSVPNLDEQDSLLSEAIDNNPSNAVAYNNRAFVYIEKKEYAKAVSDCNIAIKLNNQYIYPYKNRARAYLFLGGYEQAIDDCNKIISLKSDFGEAYYIRAHAYYEMGDENRFYEDIKKAWSCGF